MRELERKISIDASTSDIIQLLTHAGHVFEHALHQVDTVFAVDAATVTGARPGSVVARIREEGLRTTLTVKERLSRELDRREVEIVVDDATASRQILEMLGLQQIVTVDKTRWLLPLSDNTSLCIDDVVGLGTFIEVEVLLSDGSEGGEVLLDAAIGKLAELGLVGDMEHRGYDTLLISADRPT